MNILIGGGGTGGHLIPGIAMYKEFQKNPHHKLLYVLSNRDEAYDIVYQLSPEDRITVSLKGISRKLSFSSLKQVFSIAKAWYHSHKAIKKFNPDLMIITGGYLSNIVALSALLMRKPLYIIEPNSAAGITNRFWAKRATKIFTTQPNPTYIPKEKIVLTGTPLLYTGILPVEEAKGVFELRHQGEKTIGISGGSQGAMAINDMVLSVIPTLVERGYHIIWSLGTKEYDRLAPKLSFLENAPYKDNVRVYRFITQMNAFWSAADVVIARGGAGTVSEALLFKTPVLFIPIHESPDNHQYLNAKFLKDYNVAEIIEEPSLSEEDLLNTLSSILENHHFYQSNFPHLYDNPAQKINEYILKNQIKN